MVPMTTRPRARVDLELVTVLIVDDFPVTLSALDEALQADDTLIVVGAANSIGAAIDLASYLKPDVAVMDVNMPDGGGWALAQGLRHAVPGIRMVAYSAFDDALLTRTIAAAGISAYVTKGSDVQLLIDAIHGAAIMPSRDEPRALMGRLGSAPPA